MPPISIDGPNTPPLPPELIVKPVATIFSSAKVRSSRIPMWGTKLGSPASVERGRHADRAPLHPAVAAGHHLRERQGHEPQQQAAHRRLDLPGDRHRLEEPVAQPVEDADVEPAHGRAGERQDREQGQLAEAVEGQLGQAEDRPGRDEQRERRIGDDRAGQAGEQGRRFEGRRRVEDLAGEQAPPSGARKIAPTPPAAPASIKSRRSVGGSFRSPAKPRSEARADLRDRALLSGRAARADRDDRGDRLDRAAPAPGSLPPPRWNARIMASVPCPSASGAQVKTRTPEIRPPTAGTSTTSHQGHGYVIACGIVLARGRHLEVEQSAEDQRCT